MNEIIISPSILSGDFANMGKTVELVDMWGADFVHVDIMDGNYVPNITFGMGMVKAIRSYSDKPFDVHLMINKPINYIEEFANAGADYISFHPDSNCDVFDTLNFIKKCGKKCGLAISPDMAIEEIVPYIENLDIIIIMGVYPGFGGQKYIERINNKIIKTKEIVAKTGKKIIIELDGGVTEDNCKELITLGCNALVAGNAVFKSQNPSLTIKKLRG